MEYTLKQTEPAVMSLNEILKVSFVETMKDHLDYAHKKSVKDVYFVGAAGFYQSVIDLTKTVSSLKTLRGRIQNYLTNISKKMEFKPGEMFDMKKVYANHFLSNCQLAAKQTIKVLDSVLSFDPKYV